VIRRKEATGFIPDGFPNWLRSQVCPWLVLRDFGSCPGSGLLDHTEPGCNEAAMPILSSPLAAAGGRRLRCYRASTGPAVPAATTQLRAALPMPAISMGYTTSSAYGLHPWGCRG
jgi:hypothetical protein